MNETMLVLLRHMKVVNERLRDVVLAMAPMAHSNSAYLSSLRESIEQEGERLDFLIAGFGDGDSLTGENVSGMEHLAEIMPKGDRPKLTNWAGREYVEIPPIMPFFFGKGETLQKARDAQARKVAEEATELVEAYAYFDGSHDCFDRVEEEWSDCVLALANAASLWEIDVDEAMRNCIARQADRGRYERE